MLPEILPPKGISKISLVKVRAIFFKLNALLEKEKLID